MRKVANVPSVDPTLPKVEIKLGGEIYYLVFTFKALALAAAKLREKGVHVNLLHSLDLTSLDADKVAPLLYASLITHQPDLTIDQVTELVTLRSLGAVFEGIAKAYTESLAEPTQDAGVSKEGKE